MGAPMAPGAADPSQDPNAAPAEAQGYTICLHVGPGGELSVGLDDDDSENEATEDPNADPAGGESAEGSNMRPAKDIKDALTQILAIYKADGQASADAQFDAGFGKGQ